ncbi:MAG: GNAT family N-acetyltransferase [Acidimicrobiales bacterium]|nr:GNAT family N-acetyltransferase [Acidimicrobiales bacterium]
MDRAELVVRRATDDDIPDAIDVAAAALGWDPADPNEAFFRWKHLDNPAGRSPMWLALDGAEIAGFRTMMRWNFVGSAGPRAAVRAVDTATHPDHQRRGIFRLLSTTAVDELTREGIEFVFNTPNDNSRPGYLRMGWREVGRVPTRFAVTGVRAIPRLARARTAAHKWSEPIDIGEPVDLALDDLVALADAMPAVEGLATDRTRDHLAWRYGFEPLHYRVVRTDDGAAVVRVRRRGAATEAVLAELFSPDVAASRTLLRAVRRRLPVDHVLTLATPPHPAPWMPTLPRLGPRLTVRDLAGTGPDLDQFRFSLGDIELF